VIWRLKLSEDNKIDTPQYIHETGENPVFTTIKYRISINEF
jgi:hypothetical protein